MTDVSYAFSWSYLFKSIEDICYNGIIVFLRVIIYLFLSVKFECNVYVYNLEKNKERESIIYK